MSLETCLGSIQSSDVFQGPLYLLKKIKTDSEITISMFGIKFITDYVTHRRSQAQRELLKAHEAAVLASTGGKALFGLVFSCSRLLSESRDML